MSVSDLYLFASFVSFKPYSRQAHKQRELPVSVRYQEVSRGNVKHFAEISECCRCKCFEPEITAVMRCCHTASITTIIQHSVSKVPTAFQLKLQYSWTTTHIQLYTANLSHSHSTINLLNLINFTTYSCIKPPSSILHKAIQLFFSSHINDVHKLVLLINFTTNSCLSASF